MHQGFISGSRMPIAAIWSEELKTFGLACTNVCGFYVQFVMLHPRLSMQTVPHVRLDITPPAHLRIPTFSFSSYYSEFSFLDMDIA